MDRLHEMQVFVAVADEGSLAGGGRRLRLSPPAVTRAIASLETRLGVRVFNRSTRSLSLTEAGERFLLSSRRLLSEIEAAEKEAAGDSAIPRGHLTLTAPTSVGQTVLPAIMSGFLEEYPQVSASVVLLDRVANLIEEGIDVGVRVGDLPDSSLMARRIGKAQRILVASPDYLERHGVPRHPNDLKAHAVIGFTGLMPNREWRYSGEKGRGVMALDPRLETNDIIAAIAAAENGDGVTATVCHIVGEKIRQGSLRPVLADYWPEPAPVHLIYAPSRLIAPKIRAFVDYVGPRLGHALTELSAPAAEFLSAVRR